VVSDFHLGKGRYLSDGSPNLLEDFVYDREFAEFLEYYTVGEFSNIPVELVLNGDILNLLQVDYYGVHSHLMTERSVCYALEKIIEGHSIFFEGLKKFSARPHHTITYVVGNHDIGMIFKKAQVMFSRACAPFEAEPENDTWVSFYDERHIQDGILIEHGQQYERFAKVNMQDPFVTRGFAEPVINLPWGSLFVAVILPKIKMERPHVDKVRPFEAFFRWVVIHDFFWMLKTAYRSLIFTFQTLILKTKFQVFKGVSSQLRLLKEMTFYPSYDRIALRLLKADPQLNAVIFGHTHILRYRRFPGGKEYFNEGSWNEASVETP
jgi:UDP-2,3-diacylglucosamine pyrophosphatase LpxH